MKRIAVFVCFFVVFPFFVNAQQNAPEPYPDSEYRWNFSLIGEYGVMNGVDDDSLEDTGSSATLGLAYSWKPYLEVFGEFKNSKFDREPTGFSSKGYQGLIGLRLHSDRSMPVWLEFSAAAFGGSADGSDDGDVYSEDMTQVGVRIGAAAYVNLGKTVLPFMRAGAYVDLGVQSGEYELLGETEDLDESGVAEYNLEARLGLVRFGKAYIFASWDYFSRPWSNDLVVTSPGIGIQGGGKRSYFMLKLKWNSQEQGSEDITELDGFAGQLYYSYKF